MCSEAFSLSLKTSQQIRIRLVARNKTHFINKRVKFVHKNRIMGDIPINYELDTDFVTVNTDRHNQIDLFLGKIVNDE